MMGVQKLKQDLTSRFESLSKIIDRLGVEDIELLHRYVFELNDKEVIDVLSEGDLEVYSTWNLKRYVTEIYAVDKSTSLILDVDAGEIYVEYGDDYIPFEEDYYYENLEDLNGKRILNLFNTYFEELKYYGNGFSIILPLSTGKVIAIRGKFIDNTVFYTLPLDELDENEKNELIKWLDKNRLTVWNLFKTYTWRPIDLLRGYSEGANETETWEKVVDGWVSWSCSSKIIEKLSDYETLRANDYTDYPVLFVFPRNTNILVTYFDVYVPKGKKEHFKEFLGIPKELDEIDLDKGYYIRTIN